jgi:predicted Zn-dependent protease
MTRKKKTRSLKRIHSVKTGTPSKLKRASTVDRQSTSLKAKNKPKSVYQKFLDENPDAVEKQQQSKVAAEKVNNKPAEKKTKPENKTKPEKIKPSQKETDDERSEEREPDLLSQLDNKNFNDLY